MARTTRTQLQRGAGAGHIERIRSSRVIGLTLALSVLFSGVALADWAQGDIAEGTGPATVTAGEPFEVSGRLFLQRQGQAAATVTWNRTSNSSGCPAGLSVTFPSGNQMTMPETWAGKSNTTLSTVSDIDRKVPVTFAGTAGADGTNCEVTFTASDSASNIPSGRSTVVLTINFVAPTVTNSPPSVDSVAFASATVSCGTNNATLDVEYSDPDVGDTHTATINWGDGTTDGPFTVSGGEFSRQHTYALAGSYTATVIVTDQGGLFDSDTAAVAVLYNTSGILQPINADGSSTFKVGSTIPVQAVFTNCDGSLPASNPRIELEKVSNGAGSVNELVSSSAADIGNWMRYADDKYKFNLSTKRSQFNAGQDLTGGTYELTIKIDGMTQFIVSLSLRQ